MKKGITTTVPLGLGILQSTGAIRRILITAYEPAFGIIGDPAKRDPKTRQSADHSMVYIVGTLLRKAAERVAAKGAAARIDDPPSRSSR